MLSVGAEPSILLILPFFGPLPNYASLFFKSCAKNPSINWLIVTDQRIDERALPTNVSVRVTTFPRLKRQIDDCMGIDTALRSPYKLCDFKPAYGVLFADDVAGFDFWGHCDMDLIFGDVRRFITKDILNTYDKVLIHGHLSLYRNCEAANHYFQLTAPGVHFKDVFVSPRVRSFSEFRGVLVLLKHHKIPFFRDDSLLADIDFNVHKMQTVQSPNHRHQYFSWEDGRIFRSFWEEGRLRRQEYMYIHLQKRQMKPPASDLCDRDAWFITPGEFLAKTEEVRTLREIDRLNEPNPWFDLKRTLFTSLWRVKWTVSQIVDPWPRRS